MAISGARITDAHFAL